MLKISRKNNLLAVLFIWGAINICIICYFHDTLTRYYDEEDLSDLIEEEGKSNADLLKYGLPVEKLLGKEEIVEILFQSGENVTIDLVEKMPPYQNFTSVFGAKPKIIGLETCEAYQRDVSPLDAIVGPAGHYNTGTNLLWKLLFDHCEIEGREKLYNDTLSLHSGMLTPSNHSVSRMVKTGMWITVPWNKHGPVEWRDDESFRPIVADDFQINKILPNSKSKDVFPIVMVKDPYSWMESTISHKYGASWRYSKYSLLNLNEEYDMKHGSPTIKLPEKKRGKKILYKVKKIKKRKNVKEELEKMRKREHRRRLKGQDKDHRRDLPKQVVQRNRGKAKGLAVVYHRVTRKWLRTVRYDNLVHMWNKYHSDYLKADFPRLMIRYEDLLLHTNEVIPQICKCVGGTLVNSENGVHLQSTSSKNPKTFGKTSGLVSALMKYGNSTHRTKDFSKGDMVYANANISKELMDLFQYSFPPSPVNDTEQVPKKKE